MKFDLCLYTDEKCCMRCNTIEETRIFLNILHNDGRCWRGGRSYKDERMYYGDGTCYIFNKGTYCSEGWCKRRGYTILNFSDFEWDKYNAQEEWVQTEEFDEFLACFQQ